MEGEDLNPLFIPFVWNGQCEECEQPQSELRTSYPNEYKEFRKKQEPPSWMNPDDRMKIPKELVDAFLNDMKRISNLKLEE